ncbi:13845_t:CDS:2, partial [Dentiscutata erythropus]
ACRWYRTLNDRRFLVSIERETEMSDEPSEPTPEIDPHIKAFIENACQATITTLVEKVKDIMNQQAETQRCWNEQLQKTIDEHFSKLEQVGLVFNGESLNVNSMAAEEERPNQMTRQRYVQTQKREMTYLKERRCYNNSGISPRPRQNENAENNNS